MSFWGELRRRNVFKVGVAYAIVAWLLIQGADIVSPHLRLPEWTVPLVIILLSIGFPIALILAWAFELTPDGIKFTKEVPRAESIARLTGQKLMYVVVALLVVAVALLAVKVYLEDRHAIEPELVTTEPEQAPVVSDVKETPKTIAILPFDDLSPEKDQEYFVLGLSEEILNSLAQIPDLTVIAKTSSFSFKGKDKTIQGIASVLGVDNILEGSVRKAGNALRITAQLVKAVDGSHLWSKTYDRELKDIFAVQEDIATAVADELKLTLGIGKSLKLLGGTKNLEAYEFYLVAIGQQNWNPSDPLVQNQILKSLDAALSLDPKFALAWAYKSLIHYYISLIGPLNQSYAERDASLSAALKAIELEPNLADGYHSLGCLQSASGEFIKAESSYNKGLELSSDAFSYIYGQYLAVGKIEKAKGILEKMVRNDPLNLEIRGHYLIALGILGNMQQAEEEYERGRALFGDEWWLGNFYITQLRLSKDHSISRDDIVLSNPIYDSAKEHLESPEEGLTELYRIYSDIDNLTLLDIGDISIWAAYFGDSELAMAAIEKFIKMNNFHFWYCWYTVMREVRQLPRFKELAREVGLVDYWNEFGWPDICHQLDNGDFVCD